MNHLFSLQLLQVISDWQIGGNPEVSRLRALALERECANLPIEFKTAHQLAFGGSHSKKEAFGICWASSPLRRRSYPGHLI